MLTILANWKTFLLAGLAACLVLSLVLLNRAWSEVAEKTAVIDSMRREAQAYKDQSDQIAKGINDDVNALVEQVKEKDLALKNARARFGSCNVARGVTAVSVLHSAGSAGQADRAESPDGTGSELVVTREFINDCALDAGRLELWQEWAVKNQLPVSKD